MEALRDVCIYLTAHCCILYMIKLIPILNVIHNAFESNSAQPYPRDKEVRSTEVAKALENLQHSG